MAAGGGGLKFTVRRNDPVLITPAAPTPRETLSLSNIDGQEGLRFWAKLTHIYRGAAAAGAEDPSGIIRDGIARALVYYYPFAGRLREVEGRKLLVDCTGEGVLFAEADADVTLRQLGDPLRPPFPCSEELLPDVPGSAGILDSPTLLIQLTRLRCGGFIFALRWIHAMCDAQGLVQFMKAAAELSRGSSRPSVMPVWCRELLGARVPPRPSFPHREYDEMDQSDTKCRIITSCEDMEQRSFFFGPLEMETLCSYAPPHLRSKWFDVLTACLWKCRTIAINPYPDEEMRLIFTVSARGKSNTSERQGLDLPDGYYGNAFAFPVAISSAVKLCRNPLDYAIQLVRKAKGEVDAEYLWSVADLMALRGAPGLNLVNAFMVSDQSRVEFNCVDFGWGRPVFAGPVTSGFEGFPGIVSLYISSEDTRFGQQGIVVPVCLPAPAMARFVKEIDALLKGSPGMSPGATTVMQGQKNTMCRL